MTDSLSDKMSSLYGEKELYHSAKAAGSYNIGRTFINANPNASIRSEYTRDDYEYYRSYDSVPKRAEDKLLLCMKAYDNVGIVRNVIDLMSDFACKGVSIVHPNVSQERFYKEWWSYIDGDLVSERFVNYIYRIANVPVSVSYGKVPVTIEKTWSSAYGANEFTGKDIEIKKVKTETRRIPLKYSFINPLTLEVIAPELALFTGKTIFGLRISPALRSSLVSIRNKYPELNPEEINQMIPQVMLDAIRKGKTIVPIDNSSISMYYYKKDDWDVWAKPMVSSILDDLIMFEKAKLSDMSALDGAISNIRLWKIGKMDGDNPSSWVIPTMGMINKVRNIIANNVGGGTLDLVWGPDIDFKESNTNVHNFLGSTKYEPILANIYEGLGVPFGTSGGAGKGMTNNFIAMQTFIERLEYGRRVLLNFWNTEIKKVQLAMGHSKPAEIIFDRINLGDDNSYKQLLVGLLDRDIISDDAVRKDFGFTDIEKVRVSRNTRARGKRLPQKASPFHNPLHEHDMKKILLQRGGVAPSELGITLQDKKPGEKSPNEQMEESQIKLAKITKTAQKEHLKKAQPVGSAGRPDGSTDKGPRKEKKPPVQTKAADFMNMFIWGCSAQKTISDITTPILLKAFNKPNVRSLSSDEIEELETVKLTIFSNVDPLSLINAEYISKILEENKQANINIVSATKLLLGMFRSQNNREPSIDEMRQIQASGFALAHDNTSDDSEYNDISKTELELAIPELK